MSQLAKVFDPSQAWETRTQTAFRWSVEELFEGSKAVYLWTFTLVKAMPSWWIGPTWQGLQHEIYKTYGVAQGVRVFEWHKNHGLHVHMLINRRMPVSQIRRIAARLGFGRINVKRCWDVGAGRYLAKYLGKDAGKIPHGGRAWARIGRLGCAVNSVEFVSPSLTLRKEKARGLRNAGVECLTAWNTVCREEDMAFEDEARREYRAAIPNPF